MPLVTVEHAKTGRASCRRCREKLDKGDLRIGLEVWITGRQSMVWQRPACFGQGLSVAPAASSRGKCKCGGCNASFVKGEQRLTITAHNSAIAVRLQCAAGVLAGVVEVMPTLAATDLDGHAELAPDELQLLEQALKPAGNTGVAAAAEPTAAGKRKSVDAVASVDDQDDNGTAAKKNPKKAKKAKKAKGGAPASPLLEKEVRCTVTDELCIYPGNASLAKELGVGAIWDPARSDARNGDAGMVMSRVEFSSNGKVCVAVRLDSDQEPTADTTDKRKAAAADTTGRIVLIEESGVTMFE